MLFTILPTAPILGADWRQNDKSGDRNWRFQFDILIDNGSVSFIAVHSGKTVLSCYENVRRPSSPVRCPHKFEKTTEPNWLKFGPHA